MPSVFSGFDAPDLWERLENESRDILLYGMGNGADKILAVLSRRGIPVAGIFASDGFVRGHSFHGMPVRSFSWASTRAMTPLPSDISNRSSSISSL